MFSTLIEPDYIVSLGFFDVCFITGLSVLAPRLLYTHTHHCHHHMYTFNASVCHIFHIILCHAFSERDGHKLDQPL